MCEIPPSATHRLLSSYTTQLSKEVCCLNEYSTPWGTHFFIGNNISCTVVLYRRSGQSPYYSAPEIHFYSFWRRYIVVIMDFDCYTGDRDLIPTHDDSLGKWMNLLPGQPIPCEGNWVVSPRCWRDIDLHSAVMGFSASCNSTIYIHNPRRSLFVRERMCVRSIIFKTIDYGRIL